MRRAILGLTLCALLGAGIATAPMPAPALAQGPAPSSEPQAERELTRDQALQLVQKRYGARVVRTQEVDDSGRHLYVFRLLSSGGKVWTVRIDAHSGAEVN